MKLLIDMNLSPRWVGVLVDGGFEATHWSALGRKDAPDAQIMAYARANDYVVLTHDLDFGAILAANQGEKPSVVQVRTENVSPDILGDLVIAALKQMEAGATARGVAYHRHDANAIASASVTTE